MKQVLLYSINAEHLVNILNGLKTIEVRKRDLPQWAKDKLARGEKVVGYGYCTKSLPNLFYNPEYHNYVFVDSKVEELSYHYRKDLSHFNGRVVVKFEVNRVKHIPPNEVEWFYDDSLLLVKAHLSPLQIIDYANGKDLYTHHLTNIQPVNMELMEFYKKGKYENSGFFMAHRNEYNFYKHLTKAPQSFQTAWVKGE